MIRSSSIALALGVAAASLAACAPRPRMCSASAECFAHGACVAGRCQPDKANVRPAIDSARRLVVRPVDVAYLRRGGDEAGVAPAVFRLGTGGALLLMRFSVALDPGANVVEAYVVLHRSDDVDDDPTPISLHATRIVDPWQARSTSFARHPRLAETRAPSTLVLPGGPRLVRVDVRDLVRHWPKHDPRDQGVALVAENESRTGTAFALADLDVDGAEPASVVRPSSRATTASSSAPDVEPYLELYVR